MIHFNSICFKLCNILIISNNRCSIFISYSASSSNIILF
nr:MAG TPA: hypothetical protein [Bacteriophage sp.]